MNTILSLLVAIVFASAGPAEEHRFPAQGFALVAPGEDWTVGPGQDTAGGFKVDLTRRGDGGLVAVSALCDEVKEGTSSSTVLQAGLAALVERDEYRDHVLLEPSLIAGLEATGADVSWELAGVGSVHIRMVYVVSGNRAWLLQGHSPLERWEEVQPAVQSFLAGFRLIDIEAEDRAAMLLETLMERCGSELDWAPDWEAAAERSRSSGKPILTVVHSYPGFDLPDTTRLFTFMHEDLLALVQAELIPLRLEAGMPAPMRDPAKYGMGPSTFGVALLLCDAEGEVLAETPHVEPGPAMQWLRQELAPLGWSQAVPDDPVDAARQALDRGQFEDAQQSLERLLPKSRDEGRVRILEQLARARRLQRDADGALRVLDQAGPLAGDGRLLCERAETLLHLGDLAGVRAALEPLLDGESSEQPRALFLTSLAAQELEGVLAARPARERLVRDHPDSRWAWLAAAMLSHESLMLQVDSGGTGGGWPRAEVLAFLLDPPTEPGSSKRVGKSMRQATSWLLETQREEGSWPYSSELNRAESLAPGPLATAINALSVRALLQQGQNARKAAKRGLKFLLKADLQRREQAQVVVYMDYTAWAAWSQLELLCDALPLRMVDRAELLEWGARLVADLQQRVRRNGGWSYYLSGTADDSDGPEQSISFTTGAVVIGLVRAQKAGIEVPEDLLAGALDCLEEMRNDDGYFAYMLHHPGNRPQHNTPAGAAGRGPVCELALLLGGRSDEERLEHALSLYEVHAAGLAAEGGKALMHAGADTQGCHYIFFDYMMAARAAQHLGGTALARHRALAQDMVLERRLADGSFLDTPILGRAFGSAAALLTLESLGDSFLIRDSLLNGMKPGCARCESGAQVRQWGTGNAKSLELRGGPLPTASMLALSAVVLASQFSPPTDVTLQLDDPQGVQIADIDADGQMDIVVGTRESGEVFAWRGSALGWPLQPEIVGVTETGLESMELIDLDIDGDVDLLVALPGPGLAAHLNDGAGLFGPAVPVFRAPAGTTGAVLHFDAADVSGDPRPEVVFSLAGDPLVSDRSVFALADLLGGSPTQAFLFDAASPVTGLFASDHDADGDADLFLCTLDTAAWYRNEGVFTLLGSDAVLPPGIGLDANFAGGDFDGDGHMDVISHAIGTFSTRVHAHLGDGTGEFAAPINLNYYVSSARQVLLSDLDADGDDDLVICGQFNSSLLTIESLSDGAFGPVTYSAGTVVQIPSMDAADTDGDGRAEVVYVTDSGAVRIQGSDTASTVLQLTDDIFAVTQTVANVIASSVVDLNGDGNPDVLALEPVPGRLRWWAGDGAGGVDDWEAPVEIGPDPCGLEAFDVDADGDIDLLFSIGFGDALSLVENQGGGVFASPVTIPLPAPGKCDLKAVDLDGDGLLDVVRLRPSTSSFYWSRNLGSGMFATEELLFAPAQPWQTFAFGDREGDGDLDVLIDATQSPAALTVLDWYVNDGAASFAGPFQALSTMNDLPFGFSQGIVVDDYNGDGLADVVQSLGSKGPPSGALLTIMTGTAAGTFAAPQTIDSSIFWSLWSPASADVDADGIPDMLVNSASLDWYRGRGDGTFEAPVTLVEQLAFFVESAFHSIDFDSDGDLDHVAATGVDDAVVLVETLALGDLGTAFCEAAAANSTGEPALLDATGSAQVASNAVTLEATGLPPQVPTLFVVSRTSGSPMSVLNSQGELCLTGPIGRFSGAGQVQVSSGAGVSTLAIDAMMLPEPSGFTAALAGEDWAFQAWYRDTVFGVPTSNFTSGVAVRFL